MDGGHLPVWPPLVAVSSCAAPAIVAYALRSGHVPEALIVPTVVALAATALVASALLIGALAYLIVAMGIALLRTVEARRIVHDQRCGQPHSVQIPEGQHRWEGHGGNVIPFIQKDRDSRTAR